RARGEPPGTVPGGDALVQPGPGGRAGRRGVGGRDGDAAARAARGNPGELPGHGAGLPGLARQRAAADRGGAGGRLHRAGGALRELHPPDHDPVHAAVGGGGGAPCAAHLPGARALDDAGELPLPGRGAALVARAAGRAPAAERLRGRAGSGEAVMRWADRGPTGATLALAATVLALVTGCMVGPNYVR